MRDNIFQAVNAFYYNRLDLWHINQAHITFIPKKSETKTISDFRPISVLSVLPKIITKLLATRLQPVLPHLIHQNQMIFMKDRQLMQTFLAARELMHYVHKYKIPVVFFKIDFVKVFDTLSWDYMLEVLRARDFPTLWISWIKNLLISTISHIKFNGIWGDNFYHQRGLRHGDPLSLLLFILATDTLQVILHKVKTYS